MTSVYRAFVVFKINIQTIKSQYCLNHIKCNILKRPTLISCHVENQSERAREREREKAKETEKEKEEKRCFRFNSSNAAIHKKERIFVNGDQQRLAVSKSNVISGKKKKERKERKKKNKTAPYWLTGYSACHYYKDIHKALTYISLTENAKSTGR